VAVNRTVWGYIEQRDLRLMRRVHRWRAPKWIRMLVVLSSRLGDGLVWYLLGLFILLFGGRQRFYAFSSGLLAALAAILIFGRLKKISRRRRPCHIEAHCWAMISPPDQFSFPSGHTMTSFAIAISIGNFYPQYQPYLLALAATIALSRIMLGMHFLTDVLAGGLLGIAIGYACFWLFA
jgi:undecaprenyl-diphosphatase